MHCGIQLLHDCSRDIIFSIPTTAVVRLEKDRTTDYLLCNIMFPIDRTTVVRLSCDKFQLLETKLKDNMMHGLKMFYRGCNVITPSNIIIRYFNTSARRPLGLFSLDV